MNSDKCPLLYYAVSILYRVFGYQEFLYRLLNTIIGFIGLFCVFKLSRYILEDNIPSFIIPIILFTSTVFVFYINTYITDGTALAFALMGLYQFYKYYLNKNFKHFIMLCNALSCNLNF